MLEFAQLCDDSSRIMYGLEWWTAYALTRGLFNNITLVWAYIHHFTSYMTYGRMNYDKNQSSHITSLSHLLCLCSAVDATINYTMRDDCNTSGHVKSDI